MADNRGTTDERAVIEELMRTADAPVTLSVVARADRLQIVRSVVERTMFVDDWTIDDVADVTLGVDEICSELIAASAPDRFIAFQLATGSDGLAGSVTAIVDHGVELDGSGFGWRVVETVTDAQSVGYADVGDHREVTVAFAKRRKPGTVP